RETGDVLGEEKRQGLGDWHVPRATRRLQALVSLMDADSALRESYIPTPQALRLTDPQSRECQRGEQRPPLPRRSAFEIPQLLGRQPALPARRLPLARQLQTRDGKVAL